MDKNSLKHSSAPEHKIVEDLLKQMELCKNFDLLGYKSFIKSIYGVSDFLNLQLDSAKYLEER